MSNVPGSTPAIQIAAEPTPIPTFIVAKFRRKLRRVVPSEPWEDAAVSWLLRLLEAGKLKLPQRAGSFNAAAIAERGQFFPPGGYLTKMRRCLRCELWSPPQYIRDVGDLAGCCEDCVASAMPIEALCAESEGRRGIGVVCDAVEIRRSRRRRMG